MATCRTLARTSRRRRLPVPTNLALQPEWRLPTVADGQRELGTFRPEEPRQGSRASGALYVALGRRWASAQRSLITSAAMTVMFPDATTL